MQYLPNHICRLIHCNKNNEALYLKLQNYHSQRKTDTSGNSAAIIILFSMHQNPYTPNFVNSTLAVLILSNLFHQLKFRPCITASAAKILGGKIKNRKEQLKIYKITKYQNFRKFFQLKAIYSTQLLGYNPQT